MYEKHLHLDHVAEAEFETFEDCFDLVENANCLGPGVAIGLGAVQVGLLVCDRRNLTADLIGRGDAAIVTGGRS
jgi:hypothetical protein